MEITSHSGDGKLEYTHKLTKYLASVL